MACSFCFSMDFYDYETMMMSGTMEHLNNIRDVAAQIHQLILGTENIQLKNELLRHYTDITSGRVVCPTHAFASEEIMGTMKKFSHEIKSELTPGSTTKFVDKLVATGHALLFAKGTPHSQKLFNAITNLTKISFVSWVTEESKIDSDDQECSKNRVVVFDGFMDDVQKNVRCFIYDKDKSRSDELGEMLNRVGKHPGIRRFEQISISLGPNEIEKEILVYERPTFSMPAFLCNTPLYGVTRSLREMFKQLFDIIFYLHGCHYCEYFENYL